MATLHENTQKFNQKMTVTNTGGNLSTDEGLVLVKEFLHSIGFEQLMEKDFIFKTPVFHLHIRMKIFLNNWFSN
jgi:hypothetical protein